MKSLLDKSLIKKNGNIKKIIDGVICAPKPNLYHNNIYGNL